MSQFEHLQTLGIDISADSQAVLSTALPWLQKEHKLTHIQFWGEISNLKGAKPYLIVFGYPDGTETPAFFVTQDMVKWVPLTCTTAHESQLDNLGYTVDSQKPFIGRLKYTYPVPEKEEGDDDDGDDAVEDGEDEGAKAGTPVKVQEMHRLCRTIRSIHVATRLVVHRAFLLKGGDVQRNKSYKPAVPSASSICHKDEMMQALRESRAPVTLADRPYSDLWGFEPMPAVGADVAASVLWPGAIYYVFRHTIVWGSFYRGRGIKNINSMWW
eukprot:gnl/Dysnectes_brevis/6209_a9461_469.p1 GENE.gnl/Dysnectes_brevis/6209_a9461_469~~gnl/Dysnectes_brevis/6209_a9461_469.p1  ORF type:complete len:293 (+),score=70.12 gnl/Dysnectes_brevis/6209_a9461_469:72-881(+)